jgi:Mrp family chromosome partitioning ATPase
VELSFIFHALRRFWWVVVVCILLLGGVALAVANELVGKYESKAVLLIAPPTGTPVPSSENPDRYIVGQLSVLASDSFTSTVAAALNDGTTVLGIQTAMTVAQSPSSDVVTITVSDVDPQRAQKIADTVVTLYFDQLNAFVSGSQATEIAKIDNRILSVQSELAEVYTGIAKAIKPYLAAGTFNENQNIPTPEQLVPDLASRRDNLLAQATQLATIRSQLESSAAPHVTSEVVQAASLPTSRTVLPRKLILAGGLFGGAAGGLVLALIMARLSRWLLDDEHAEEVLDEALVGWLPREPGVKNRSASLEHLPLSLKPIVEMICVRAEANAVANEALTIAVVGTERGAGATTLALAMANRYATGGSEVLVIDADGNEPELSRAFPEDSIGLTDMMAMKHDSAAHLLPTKLLPRGSATPAPPTLPSCHIPGLHLVTRQSRADVDALRRFDIRQIIAEASHHAGLVIFDAGALFGTASSIHLSQIADVVVLAVPLRRQRVRGLTLVAQQLQNRRGQLLPVATPMKFRRWSLRRRRRRVKPPATHRPLVTPTTSE